MNRRDRNCHPDDELSVALQRETVHMQSCETKDLFCGTLQIDDEGEYII